MKALLFTIPLLLVTTLSAKDVILDTTTSLVWQDTPINKDGLATYKEAQSFCKFLSLGKYDKFRLPTMFELQTLVDYNKYDPAILSGFKYISSTTYWTTTVFADDAEEFWTVDFEKGSRSVKATYYDRHFRCVQKLN